MSNSKLAFELNGEKSKKSAHNFFFLFCFQWILSHRPWRFCLISMRNYSKQSLLHIVMCFSWSLEQVPKYIFKTNTEFNANRISIRDERTKKKKTEIMLNWIWQTAQHISANPFLRKFALCGLTCLDLVDEKSSVRLFGFLLFLLSRKCSTMLFTANKIESMISRQTIEKGRLSLWVCFFRAKFCAPCIYHFIPFLCSFSNKT